MVAHAAVQVRTCAQKERQHLRSISHAGLALRLAHALLTEVRVLSQLVGALLIVPNHMLAVSLPALANKALLCV